MSRNLAKQYVAQKKDADERVLVLRLQAMAWRHVALIATADPIRGATLAQWLIFKTVPFTDGDAVQKFVTDTEKDAEAAGRQSGVFTSRALMADNSRGAQE